MTFNSPSRQLAIARCKTGGRATACGGACQLTTQTITSRNRANSSPHGARSVKRQPAFHCGSGKRVRAAHCSSRVVWFQWTGLSARRLQDWKAGVLSSGTISRNCMVSSRATVCGDACQLTTQTITSRNRANSSPHGARSVKRQPAFHCGSGKRVRAAHCSSRVVWFQWTGLSARRLQDWKAGVLSSGTDLSELHGQ